MTEPRLMTEATARAYLDGVSPATVMPPQRLGKRLVWDRVALDRRLDELFGVERDARPEGAPVSALERWKRGKGHGAHGA